MNIVSTWRDDIAAELATKQPALAESERELTAAKVASDAAGAAHRGARAAIASITNPHPGRAGAPLVAPLALRLRSLEAAQKAAEQRHNAAHNAREAVRREIGELERALAQLDTLIESVAEAA